MNIRLKQALETVVQIFEAIAPMDMEYFDLGAIELDSMRMCFARFLCYLSISDDEISWDECEVIEEYCGLNFAPEEIAVLSEALLVNTEEYRNAIPVELMILLSADNDMFERGIRLEQYSSELFIEVLKGLALVLMTSDGEVSDLEQMDYYSYILNLETYIDDNLLSHKQF